MIKPSLEEFQFPVSSDVSSIHKTDLINVINVFVSDAKHLIFVIINRYNPLRIPINIFNQINQTISVKQTYSIPSR